jgi:hypothetical protein
MNNPMQALQTLVDATEKLYLLPHDEILKNGELVNGIRNAVSAHNIDSIVNAARNAMNEFTGRTESRMPDESGLLNAYARREHKRVQDVDAVPFITEIINAGKDLKGKQPTKTRGKAEKDLIAAFNSVYANGAMKINTSSDPSTLMSYIDYSPYRVNYTEYLSMPTLSEMVDRPIAMALKKFPKIKAHNESFQDELTKVFKKIKLNNVLKDALMFSVLSPRGSLTVPIKRGDEVTFNVFNDTQFAYGMGSSYSGVTAPYMSTRVGDLYCMGAKLRHGVSAHFLCPGYEPLFGVGLNRVPQLRAAAEAWNLYVHVLKILLVRSQVLIEKMDGDIQTDTMLSQMRAQLQRLSQTMGVSTPVAQARGATLDILNNNISPGTSDIAPVIQSFASSVTGVAPEYFFGGGNAAYSQAAFQIAVTNENIRARYQIPQIEPLLRFIINTLILNDSRVMSLGVEPDDFEIEFESIYDETEQEKSDLNGKKTETLIRQCEYPELEDAFKKLGLLSKEITLKQPVIQPPKTDGGDNEIKDDSKDSVLAKPLG